MSNWRPIETAPKDGTFVLLKGGRDDYSDGNTPPCVVAFYEPYRGGIGSGGADYGCWMYAYWDSGWRSGYEDPTHWMPTPG